MNCHETVFWQRGFYQLAFFCRLFEVFMRINCHGGCNHIAGRNENVAHRYTGNKMITNCEFKLCVYSIIVIFA